VGGGIACFLFEKNMLPADLEEDDRKLLVLSGMAAAMGSLFPSPILTVMMLFELGHPPRSPMEAVTILSFASAVRDHILVSFMFIFVHAGLFYCVLCSHWRREKLVRANH
jgi:H+/Cl- antiporter ClcA